MFENAICILYKNNAQNDKISSVPDDIITIFAVKHT